MEQDNQKDFKNEKKRQARKVKKQEHNQTKSQRKEQKSKIDEAKKLAAKSKKTIDSQYNSLSSRFVRLVQKINSWLDRIINSPTSSMLFALLISLVFFVSLTGFNSSFNRNIASGDTIKDVPLQAIYNSEVFEVQGLPETVDLTLVGDRSSISATRSSGAYEAYVDLTGLREGKNYNVPIRHKGIVGDLRVVSSPTTVDVTIERKVSQSFALDSTLINTNQKDGVYIVGTPVLDTSSVIVRASQATLNEISAVRAMIDVSSVNQVGDYTQQAQLVAFDQDGLPMNVDILPSEVTVDFNVSSPNKDVRLNIIPQGTPKEGYAISSLVANNESTTIYAPQEVLDTITEIDVFVDVEGLSSDDKIIATVPLPAGVSKTTVDRVGVLVTFGPAVTERIPVRMSYANNSGYRLEIIGSDLVDVVVTGTQERIDELKKQMAENDANNTPLTVYFDLTGLTPGRHDNVPLNIRATDSALRYELVRNAISISISE